MSSVRTRFAPSPTGLLHGGNYRTGIFAYLYARKHKGTFVLRIEDTDRERSKKEYEENILETLSWLGLEHDELYRQSDRVERHTEQLQALIASGHAYESEEPHKETGVMRKIVRFKNPGGALTFTDAIRGDITVDTTDLKDFVIAKSLTEPLFHLAVVVDDADMNITHVIRGDDHISNTPRQILIQRALGLPTPIYAHLPLVLAPDRTKLSKRKGAKSITEYRDLGYLPESLLNFLAMVGWNAGTDQELFTKEELIEAFDLPQIQKHGAIFNEEKLQWVNKEYMQKLSEEELTEKAGIKNTDSRIVHLAKERAHTLKELKHIVEDELAFFSTTPVLEKEMLTEKGGDTKGHLKELSTIIETFGEETIESIKEKCMPYADLKGRAEVLWPLRYLLSGLKKSPDPFTILHILPKEESLKRIENALGILGE